MRRVALTTALLFLLTACGKKVPVAPIAAATPASELRGLASYYAEPYTGRPTASGEIFDTYQQMTAAHRTLPFNTMVRVTNEQNGRNVDVRINDRGPFVEGRVIDLSLKAAQELDLVRAGVAPVKLTVLGPSSQASVPKPETAPRATATAPAPAAAYTVQVGAFSSQDAADSLKKDLEMRYSDVAIETSTASQTLYRVRIGRFPDLASAESLMNLLRQEMFDPFVVRLN